MWRKVMTKWIPTKNVKGEPSGRNKETYDKTYSAKIARSAKNEKDGKYAIDTYRNEKTV
jgi:ribosomal protein L14E/L6E/L27E